MQVWLQRTGGCIALSSLGFFGANLWGCVGWVGHCAGGGGIGEGVCLCYVQSWARSSSTQLG